MCCDGQCAASGWCGAAAQRAGNSGRKRTAGGGHCERPNSHCATPRMAAHCLPIPVPPVIPSASPTAPHGRCAAAKCAHPAAGRDETKRIGRTASVHRPPPLSLPTATIARITPTSDTHHTATHIDTRTDSQRRSTSRRPAAAGINNKTTKTKKNGRNGNSMLTQCLDHSKSHGKCVECM